MKINYYFFKKINFQTKLFDLQDFKYFFESIIKTPKFIKQ